MQRVKDGFGFIFEDVQRLLRSAFARAMRGNQLSVMQVRAVLCVYYFEGLRQIELAELLSVQPIVVSRLVDSLEKEHRLLERRADPTDRRAFRIYLAPDAHERVGSIIKIGDAIVEKALQGFSPAEARMIVDLLQRVRSNLS